MTTPGEPSPTGANPPDDAGISQRVEEFLVRSRDRLALSGFRKFILRGNVVDLAIGVVIGAAFTGVVNSLVKDFLTPIIGVAMGGHTTCTQATPTSPTICQNTAFSDRHFTVHGSQFNWGDFVNSVLTLVLIGLALYYFVVLPVNSLMERFKPDTDVGKRTKTCPECKSAIPYDATRCAFCTVEQPPLEEAALAPGP